jgi:hypothetical protein
MTVPSEEAGAMGLLTYRDRLARGYRARSWKSVIIWIFSPAKVQYEKRGTAESHRPATPDEIREGKFFKDHAEYLADVAEAG